MALAFAIGHISGGHFNPAVTLGLIAGGRVAANSAVGYIVAQCAGAIVACGVFAIIGSAPPTFAANGYDALSMTKAGMLSVFLIETVLTAFLVFVIMGATNRRAPAGFAPIAVGATLAAIHIMAIPISNASVNPARSLGSAHLRRHRGLEPALAVLGGADPGRRASAARSRAGCRRNNRGHHAARATPAARG